MADDLSKRGAPDAIRINIHEPWEVTSWCNHFKITADQLKEAVKKVGPMTVDVKRYLGK